MLINNSAYLYKNSLIFATASFRPSFSIGVFSRGPAERVLTVAPIALPLIFPDEAFQFRKTVEIAFKQTVFSYSKNSNNCFRIRARRQPDFQKKSEQIRLPPCYSLILWYDLRER